MKQVLAAVLAALPFVSMAQPECYAEIWQKSEVRPVAQRLDTSAPGAEAKLRASTAKPTPREKEALAFLLDGVMACQKIAHEARKDSMHPEAQAVMRSYEMDTNALITKLYASRISWGEFTEGREKAWAEFLEKAQTVNAKIQAHNAMLDAEIQRRQQLAAAQAEEQRKAALRADFERQQQAETAQRQAELDRQAQAQRDVMNGLILMQAARPQPRPNPLMTPSINCVSRPGAGTVFTTCN
ncbi:hypothetical protein QF021_001964 [Acidovorax delafieldii]|uniref:hypothetical protein n=1 Tax=Acidovorax delafieldii TaxID=47920 RepID=UPI00285E1258|nr:hypothetical protein [Acidovorax delafieldii]MDR6153875.1 hypothetical protein [Acidovorax delafieldii]